MHCACDHQDLEQGCLEVRLAATKAFRTPEVVCDTVYAGDGCGACLLPELHTILSLQDMVLPPSYW